MEKTVRIRILGVVQGVTFRYSAQRLARKLGIRGWVANREDGSVEAVACGEEESLKEFLDFCRRGPSRAEVRNVKTKETGECAEAGFAIR